MAIGDLWALEGTNGTEYASVDSSGNLVLAGGATLAGALSATSISLSGSLAAASVSVADAPASIVATNAEAAIAELSTPVTLTAGAEAANVIAVTVAGPAHVAQYVARVYDSSMLLAVVGAFRCAETGAGAEVSATAKPSLLFTTSAAGAATISVTDVAGASSAQVYLEVSPMSVQAGAKAGPSAIISLTFDGA